MDRGRVGEDRGSKETDGCPLTVSGCWVHSLDRDTRKKMEKSHFFYSCFHIGCSGHRCGGPGRWLCVWVVVG
jgi:hypothetical protein